MRLSTALVTLAVGAVMFAGIYVEAHRAPDQP